MIAFFCCIIINNISDLSVPEYYQIFHNILLKISTNLLQTFSSGLGLLKGVGESHKEASYE
jgi:hypothetical protein